MAHLEIYKREDLNYPVFLYISGEVVRAGLRRWRYVHFFFVYRDFLKPICIWKFSEFALASHHMIDFTLRMHCPDEIKGLPVFQTLGRSFQPCAAWTDLLGGAGDPCACSEVRIAFARIVLDRVSLISTIIWAKVRAMDNSPSPVNPLTIGSGERAILIVQSGLSRVFLFRSVSTSVVWLME